MLGAVASASLGLRISTAAVTAPAKATIAATRSAAWNPSRNASGGVAPAESALGLRDVRIAPMTAIPSAPPTWRKVFRTPEETPALATGTAPMAAAVIGVIVMAMPTPPMTSPGTRSQKPESRPSREKRTSEPATSVSPPAISQREPIRSESLPASGATRMIRNVIGRKIAPAWTGE